MASPTIPSGTGYIGAGDGSAVTSHTLPLFDVVAGNLFIQVVRFPGAPGTVTLTGWTQLASDTSDASDDQTMVFYRLSDGTEGFTATLTTGTAVKAAGVAWTISGSADPATQPPEISTVAIGTTTANTANPASRAVTGGPKDVLYLAIMGIDGEGSITAAPTNYTGLVTANTGTTGAVALNCVVGGAHRAISASSSDDPGVFTHTAGATGWAAYTVVIHPPAAGAPGPATMRRQRRASRFLTFR